MNKDRPADRVAVTGTGVLCATAGDTDGFRRALRAGTVGIGLRPETEDGLSPRVSADLAGFDVVAAVAARTDLPEPLRRTAIRVAARAPLAVRAAVVVALEGWDRAALHRKAVPSDRVGIVVAGHNLGGRYADDVQPRYETSPVHLPARYALHFLDTDHVGTVSEVLGVTGEGYTVGGASASGNVAIINGMRLVTSGAVDVCLVLGALTDLSGMERQSFYNLGAMATTTCRPFDVDREGFVPGQAAACLVLESPESAAERGVPALGHIAGYAQRLDATRLAEPSVAAEATVMAAALRHARLAPDRVGYVNTHGTGSRIGDETEARAIREVFGAATPWLNSTKGLVGHCLCAAGVVEAVATLVQLRHGFLHPNAGLTRPLDDTSRFVGPVARDTDVDFALSNAFGFGGFNTSVVVARNGAPS
ncbi:beta-ketoacyl synthase N-terminal-like domain-containing protein [Virgisporangium aurantiacum]|uniref:Polyketide biosynthesis malonyl-ACP decarboxylase PksF n=1 Tax=Virgisporangium aurantiacum TaxID=175570 RepID=A0A8J4DYD8_9ACTN|nr:beta-ketoacyl synthase N-terminal-like domain-containing protein [Virgisporangium aurantiacum]GIJ54804.1 polyketide biosynthesis malonyl-ACP decarboxylase PksF [Virgisporangium aurantiacum]